MKILKRAVLGLICVVFGFGTAVAASKPIRIAVAGPFSGQVASMGDQLKQGASMAAKHINAKGGVHGRQVVIVEADDACEPKQAVAVANRLVVKEKIDAVVGHFCSSSTIPASNIYNDAGILMITPASTNPQVTMRGLKTVFRMCGRDDQQGIIAAEFIAKRLKSKRVAIIHDKDTYGQGLADETRSNLKKHGISDVLYEGLTRGEKDFGALVTKIKSVKADAVFFGGIHSEAGPLVRQMRQQGLKSHFISGDGIVSTEMVITAGGAKFVDGIYMSYGRDPRTQPEGQKVVKAFRQIGFEPEGYTLYTYASVQAVIAAMRDTMKDKKSKPNGLQMAEWLKKNPVNTVMGKKTWDKNGDLTTAAYVMYKWDSKGKYAELKPNEL